MATFLMDCHRSFDKVKYYLYCKAVKNPIPKKPNLPVNGVFKLLIWNKIDILKKKNVRDMIGTKIDILRKTNIVCRFRIQPYSIYGGLPTPTAYIFRWPDLRQI